MTYIFRIAPYLLIFFVAFVPRVLDLDRFLTADEFLWVDRSRNFLAGLTNPDFECTTRIFNQEVAHGLACTLRTGHPGVTTMWSGVLGFLLRWLWQGRPTSLHDYVVNISTNPLDAAVIAWERWGIVFATSLTIVLIYALCRRLFNPAIAGLAALLMALNPFYIALSRVIHHDALSTNFMVLAVLCAFVYWGEKPLRERPLPSGHGEDSSHLFGRAKDRPTGWLTRHHGWLILSGVCAGLAFLSKLPSLFLGPMIALTGLWFSWQRLRYEPDARPLRSLWLLSLDGLLWFDTTIIIFVLFWPAMWIIPQETLEVVFFLGSAYSSGGHAKGNFLLGQISNDPGPLFYPVTWLYRTTPLVLFGLTVMLGHLIRALFGTRPTNSSEISRQQRLIWYLFLLVVFIVGYGLMMTWVAKKQERYLLPIYPWLDLMAAVGLVSLASLMAGQIKLLTRRLPSWSALSVMGLLVLTVNGYFVSRHYPYYFTYYNPLLGGIQGAAQAVTLGWGEGLNLAADYLNDQDPPYPRVTSWYESTFAPYYRGPTISYSKEKGKALAGDYVTFYINQRQRKFPDEPFFDFFTSRANPINTIALHGVDHVWIYPSLGVDHYVEDQTYTGIASLLAWQWGDGDRPLIPGQPVTFELYWEYLGKRQEEPFFFRLVDGQNRVWTEGQSQLVTEANPAPENWREGEILFERGQLMIPREMPPGQYRLQIGFLTAAAAVEEGVLFFDLPPNESLITVGRAAPTTYQLPDKFIPINQPLGEALTLLGYRLPLSQTAGETIEVELVWQVEQSIPADFAVHVGLLDQSGEAHQAWFNLTLGETIEPNTTIWQPGDIFVSRWQLHRLPEIPPGDYHLQLVLPDNTEETITLK